MTDTPTEEAGWYRTEYPAPCRLPHGTEAGIYGSNIYADSLRDAHRVAANRGAGERIISGVCRKPTNHPDIPKMIIGRTKWLTVLHASCFMTWHAMRAGVATPDEVLGDGGLVHEIVHVMNGIRDEFEDAEAQRKRMAELAREIESRIPGWTEGTS